MNIYVKKILILISIILITACHKNILIDPENAASINHFLDKQDASQTHYCINYFSLTDEKRKNADPIIDGIKACENLALELYSKLKNNPELKSKNINLDDLRNRQVWINYRSYLLNEHTQNKNLFNF